MKYADPADHSFNYSQRYIGSANYRDGYAGENDIHMQYMPSVNNKNSKYSDG